MKLYKVTYIEHIEYEFWVEADSKEAAEKEFNRQADECEIEFDKGEMIDTETIIEEDEEGDE